MSSAILNTLCAPLAWARRILPTDPSAGQAVATRNRRLLAGLGVLMVLMLIEYNRYHMGAEPEFHQAVSSSDRCVDVRLNLLQREQSHTGFISMTDNRAVPLVGNGVAVAYLAQRGSRIADLGEPSGTARTLPWPALQVFPTDLRDAMLVDTEVGVVRSVRRYTPPGKPAGSCQLLEQTYYAHRLYHDLVVATLSLISPGSVGNADVLLDAYPTEIDGFHAISLGNRTHDRYTAVTVLIGPANHRETGVLALSRLPSKLTSRGKTTVGVQALTVFRTVALPFDASWLGQSGLEAFPAKLRTAIASVTKRVVQYGKENLLKSHEMAWSEGLQGGRLLIRDFNSLNVRVALSSFYVMSMAPPTPPDANSAAATAIGQSLCFSGEPRSVRDMSHLQPPSSIPECETYLATLQSFLEQYGCSPAAQQGATSSWFLDSLVRAVVGVQGLPTLSALEIKPTWDLPPGALIDVPSFLFAGHEVHLRLSPSGIELHRLDRLSESLFVSDGNHRERPLRSVDSKTVLQGTPAYIAGSAETLAKIAEQGHAKAHQRPGSSRWLFGLMFLVIAVFHMCLARLVFQEYCR